MRYLLSASFVLIMSLLSFNTVSDYTITGKVIDENGRPIPGASVQQKGTKSATSTASDGTFSIVIKSTSKAILIVSWVAYETQEVMVNPNTAALTIKLKPSSKTLDSVVVVGYQTLRKKEIAASTVTVNGNALQGKAPGVHIRGQSSHFSQDKKTGYPNNTYGYTAPQDFDREGYDRIVENRFRKVADEPLSTFSIDVDGASFSNVRRILNEGHLPPHGAVRIEEMINYFHYDYPQPKDEHPFSINTEMTDCPWNTKHKLVMVGLQGLKIPMDDLPGSNLVFLIDVSGSMASPDKLPLVRQSMKLLVDQLRECDKVAIVVYAGNAGLVLPTTGGDQKIAIKDAIDRLEAGGSTAGGAGIKLAYKTAGNSFIKGGNNRVILCTDGDFNVGVSSDDELERMIEEEKKSGVFLTVLGYGTGNYQDAKMQKLSNKGNGNHSYIDNMEEARKVLVTEFGGTMFTIAKDVKLQIEFNPAKVQGYRLIGYENRMLNKEDFNNDKKDAGELGSGHTVTALYEIIPAGIKSDFLESVDKLKYQKTKADVQSNTRELMTVKFRYKKPDEDKSSLIEHPVIDESISINKTSDNFRFAAAVAQFGLLLRNSEFKQSSSYDAAWKLAKSALGEDKEGYRSGLLKLIRTAQGLAGNKEGDEDLSDK